MFLDSVSRTHFYEEYPTHKNKVVQQFSISVPHMQANMAYFGEALEVCEQFGLLDFIEINEDYDEHLVGQFFATLFFHNEDDRKITWMTKNQVFTATWAEFAALFGLQDYGADTTPAFLSTHFRVPYPEKTMGVHELYDLYIPGRAMVGLQKNLLPVYDILHRIFRNTLAPRVGNFDQIHGTLIDIMVHTHRQRGSGLKLDIMDIIWNEMYNSVMKRRVPVFAPMVMRLITHFWLASKQPAALLDNDQELTVHHVKELRIKKHLAPLIPGAAASDTTNGTSDSDFELANKTKGQGFHKWMAETLKKVFCRQEDMEAKAYRAHVRSKQERQRTRGYFAHLGVPVVAGSEDRITTSQQWKSKHGGKWVDPELEDDATTSYEPWTRGDTVTKLKT